MLSRLCFLALTALLAGCDLSAIPGLAPDPRIAQREADGKAIGGACRYALRGIEDCYTLNPKAVKSHVFTGWKEMDQYMRENKIDGAASTAVAAPEEGAAPEEKAAEAKPKADTKAEAKTDTKSKAKPEVKAKPEPEVKAKPTAGPAAAEH